MDEYLYVVDENDNILGKELKSNKLEKNFISRNVAVFIKDKQGNYIMTKRSPQKNWYPNLLDISAAGHVQYGESYEQAAKRELLEETGINCDLKFLKMNFTVMQINDRTMKYWTAIYYGEFDGEVSLEKENKEVCEIVKMNLEEIKSLAEKSPESFVPPIIEHLEKTFPHL